MSEFGHIDIGRGIRLPIIDCTHWFVDRSAAQCAAGHDPVQCAVCSHLTSRNGNWQNPPLVGRQMRPISESYVESPPTPMQPSNTRWRGLGDVVAAATKAVGIKPCGGCQKRREALNRMVPFGTPESPSNPLAPELLGDPEE